MNSTCALHPAGCPPHPATPPTAPRYTQPYPQPSRPPRRQHHVATGTVGNRGNRAIRAVHHPWAVTEKCNCYAYTYVCRTIDTIGLIILYKETKALFSYKRTFKVYNYHLPFCHLLVFAICYIIGGNCQGGPYPAPGLAWCKWADAAARRVPGRQGDRAGGHSCVGIGQRHDVECGVAGGRAGGLHSGVAWRPPAGRGLPPRPAPPSPRGPPGSLRREVESPGVGGGQVHLPGRQRRRGQPAAASCELQAGGRQPVALLLPRPPPTPGHQVSRPAHPATPGHPAILPAGFRVIMRPRQQQGTPVDANMRCVCGSLGPWLGGGGHQGAGSGRRAGVPPQAGPGGDGGPALHCYQCGGGARRGGRRLPGPPPWPAGRLLHNHRHPTHRHVQPHHHSHQPCRGTSVTFC